ncbi:MAG: colanic acid exporter, partial [Rhodocyclaceae bacterium]
FGVMALAAQALLAAGLTSAGFAACTGFRPMLRWSGEAFRAVAGFSGRLSLFNIVLYLSRNADSAIIGRLLGAAALGVYSLAYRVMLFPVQNLTHVAARALFPLMSRSGREEGAERYLKTVAFIAFITAPLMAGLFVLREPFVAVVFGERWRETATVLAWLAPVGFIQSIVSTTGTVFMAAGRSGLLLAMGCLATVLQVLAFAVGTRWGVEGVAACYLVANVINAFPALVCGAHLLGLPPLRLLREIGRPLAAALAMAVVVVQLSAWVAGHGGDTLAVLLFSILGGIAAYAAAGLLMRSQVRQLRLFLGFR